MYKKAIIRKKKILLGSKNFWKSNSVLCKKSDIWAPVWRESAHTKVVCVLRLMTYGWQVVSAAQPPNQWTFTQVLFALSAMHILYYVLAAGRLERRESEKSSGIWRARQLKPFLSSGDLYTRICFNSARYKKLTSYPAFISNLCSQL